MGKVFLTINEISEYLNLKRSTVYSMVEAGELPHYKIGRLIRFKQDEVDRWMDEHRKGCVDVKRKVKRILKGTNKSRIDIDRVVKKTMLKLGLTKSQRSRMVRDKAPIAQMDRASDYESAGRPFESGWARHEPHGVHGSPKPHMV
jgi:excisionase family DNA binding protein